MHAQHHRANGGILRVLRQHALEPGHLVGVEHVGRGVVHADEIDAALDPVIVGLDQMIVGIVGQALLPYHRLIEPVGELRDVLRPGLRRYQFVVPDPQEDREDRRMASSGAG